MIRAFFEGGLAGFAVALPLGAIAMILIFQGAHYGWRVGAAAGLGVATADGLYALGSVLSGAAFAPEIRRVQAPLLYVSALVLVCIGALIVRSGWRSPAKSGATTMLPPSCGRSYMSMLGLTIVNPATVLYFVAYIATLKSDVLEFWPYGLLFVVGVALFSWAWQVFLAVVGSMFGSRLVTERGRRVSSIVGGGLVMLLAVRGLVAP